MTRRNPFQRVVRWTTSLLFPFLSVTLTCALFTCAAYAATETAAPGKTSKKAKATKAKTSARTTATHPAAAPGLRTTTDDWLCTLVATMSSGSPVGR